MCWYSILLVLPALILQGYSCGVDASVLLPFIAGVVVDKCIFLRLGVQIFKGTVAFWDQR